MKKTLIALAAVAVSSAAFAQVTVSGTVNFNAIGNSKTVTQADGTAAVVTANANATGAQNTWTTSQVVISGAEDLGDGLKASFTINSGIAGGSAGMGDRDTNVALSGGFGTVRIGRFIPASAMAYHGYTGAASASAVGTTYGIGAVGTSSADAATGRFGVSPANTAIGSVTTATLATGNFERNSNLVQYTSPAFNGITLNLSYGKTGSDTTATDGKVSQVQTGASITYAAGPLSIAAGMNERSIQGTVDAKPADSALKANGDLDWIGASYNMGVATVSFANVKRKDVSTAANGTKTTNSDINTNVFGVSVPMGKITLNGSVYQGKNKGLAANTDDVKLSGHQISARYAFSKRTTAYALMGENKIARDGSASVAPIRKETGTMVGLLHSF